MAWAEQRENVYLGLCKDGGQKEIPFSLLYDMEGSQLYDKITALDSYYLFQAERSLLHQHADQVASQIAPGSILVELGCGNASKTTSLLSAIQQIHHRCHFVGIDVSGSALQEAAEFIREELEGVKLDILEADYLDGLRRVRTMYPRSELCVLWLGSSIGNLSRLEIVRFLNQVLSITGPRCQLFVCADMWKDPQTLLDAYQDREGVTERFIKNGMKNALSLVGHVASQDELQSWIYHVEVNCKSRQVEMYVGFPLGLQIAEQQIFIRQNERVLVEISRKFVQEDMTRLASESGFLVHSKWGSSRVYGAYFMLSAEEAILRCWEETDKMFELVTNWMAKPIPIRHPFCFYYGHVASFAKLKLLKDEQQSSLDIIFSRGVDPMVANPNRCHEHPQVPDVWPDKESVTEYAASRRAKVLECVRTGQVSTRLLNMVLEHERMHQETLWYMLVQQRKQEFEKQQADMTSSTRGMTKKNGWKPSFQYVEPDVFVPPGAVTMGREPQQGIFLWDNEQPSFSTQVNDGFVLSSAPVSIAEFMAFVVSDGYGRKDLWKSEDLELLASTGQRTPATWSVVKGEYYVHYPTCTRHLSEVLNEPVYVSLMEAEAFVKWRGCRIMTEKEYHRAMDEDLDESRLKLMTSGGWEWTSSQFQPFPGFVAMEEYPQYSADFFTGQHFVLKGSSPVTHPSLLRPSFRNFYQRQYPYVFAKFRCCK